MGSILYYEESGSGFPLILLHGNRGRAVNILCIRWHIMKFFHVIALDTRGQENHPGE